jgi:hypothetical protein
VSEPRFSQTGVEPPDNLADKAEDSGGTSSPQAGDGEITVDRATLPGWAIDLISQGADLSEGRKAVVKAVRQVMLSAHRHKVRYHDIHALLTGELTLARQVRTGRRGSQINRNTRDKFLRDQWVDTAKVAERSPAWDKNRALAAIEHVKSEFELDTDLVPKDRAVMGAVLALAEQYGTTRVAAPARKIADMTGMSPAAAHRVLTGLAADRQWLALAKGGNYKTGRASLYNLAPGLLNVWAASPPMSQPVPMSHPPMSHSEGEAAMTVALTASSPELLAQAIKLLAAASPESLRRVIADVQADSPHLRLVADDEAAQAAEPALTGSTNCSVTERSSDVPADPRRAVGEADRAIQSQPKRACWRRRPSQGGWGQPSRLAVRNPVTESRVSSLMSGRCQHLDGTACGPCVRANSSSRSRSRSPSTRSIVPCEPCSSSHVRSRSHFCSASCSY